MGAQAPMAPMLPTPLLLCSQLAAPQLQTLLEMLIFLFGLNIVLDAVTDCKTT